MDPAKIKKRLIFSRDWLTYTLIFFIIYGLVLKFFISVYLKLDSDSVGVGLMSMEIGKYQNFLLSGYHLLSTDSFVLTELLPFQLIPQILTNYNPLALKMVVFTIFIIGTLILSYIVFYVTRNVTAALIFGALAANIPPKGYHWLAFPTTHNATIVFGALILLILLIMSTSRENQKEGKEKSQKMINSRLNISWPLFLAVLALVFLTVFSDTIILLWVIIPFILAYFLMNKKKTFEMNVVIFSIIVMSIIAYGIKTYFIPGWINTDNGINSISDIFQVNIPLYAKAQMLFLNNGLYQLMQGASNINPIDILSILFLVALILYTIRNIVKDVKKSSLGKRFFYTILLISITLIVISFLISTYVYDILGARYLTFGTLAILMLVAISYPEKERIFMLIVVALLVLSGISSALYVTSMNLNPNEREYDLIIYLANHNLTYGYGTYWDSNIITYLSNEKVTIRATFFLPDRISRDRLNSCDRWFDYQPESTFLVNDTTRIHDKSQFGLSSLIKKMNVSTVLQYRNYDIYPLELEYR